MCSTENPLYLRFDERNQELMNRQVAEDVVLDIGDAGKAKRKLGWGPKVSFKELIAMMVESDLAEERLKLEGTARRG